MEVKDYPINRKTILMLISEHNKLKSQNTELLDCLINIFRKYGIPPKEEGVKLIEKHKGKTISEVLND
jgi:hypothetical protein